ncbi:MAG: sulfotransferase domain-containing protein [Spirochaetales bacterium]|nr:sulfotransferase domain-containing protein [Spirochaetales bacterium]
MVVIHIGYSKAASSTLQKNLFARHSELNNLGSYPTQVLGKLSAPVDKPCEYLTNPYLKEFYKKIYMLDGIDYSFSGITDIFNKQIKPLLDKKKINIFSHERLSSVVFSTADRALRAQRLKQFFPKAKIIIIIRNQLDIILSQYRDQPFNPHNFKIGKPLSLNRWLLAALEIEGVSYLKSLKYYELIKTYKNLFGEKNVGVFLFEDVVCDVKSFSTQLSDFIGISAEETFELLKNKKENIGMSKYFSIYRKIKRNLFPNVKLKSIVSPAVRGAILSLLKQGKKEKYRINSDLKTKLINFYASSNRKLISDFKIKIDTYSYPLI